MIAAIHDAIARLGVPANATVLEPGCGSGNFMSQAKKGMRFIGVELDSISGRIARARHPGQDIRIENFRDTKLPEDRIDAVIGNVPFADLKLDYHGQKLSLHDYFFAKSIDALKPGGVLALVTTPFHARQAECRHPRISGLEGRFRRGDPPALRRLQAGRHGRGHRHHFPTQAGTRRAGPPRGGRNGSGHVPLRSTAWRSRSIAISCAIRKWSWAPGAARTRSTEAKATASFATAICPSSFSEAIQRLPQFATAASITGRGTHPPRLSHRRRRSATSPKAVSLSATTARFANRWAGKPCPWSTAARRLRADGTLTGKRLAALVGLRDHARRVLQSQNEGWPEANRNDTRRELNWAYDRFVIAYGPINKTTFGETADGNVIRRMPNLVKFREDPDAMLVMSLEDYDEVTGKAAKAAIMTKDVVGKTPPITHVRSAEEGLLVSLNQRGTVDLPYIASLYGKPEEQVIAELGDLIFRDPESKNWQTADAYLSGNVRAKLAAAEAAGPAYRPQRRRLAGGAARGRAAGRHRRRLRRTVDSGQGHPGIRRRAVQGRSVLRARRAPRQGCRLEP